MASVATLFLYLFITIITQDNTNCMMAEVMAVIVKLVSKFAFLALIVGLMSYVILNYMVPYMHT